MSSDAALVDAASDAEFLASLRVYRDERLSRQETLPRTQNVVAKVMFADTFDLHQVTRELSHFEYQPKNFAAAIARQSEGNATTLLFKNGVMVCVGTNSREAARLACQRMRLDLRRIGYGSRIAKFEIVNHVANGSVPHRVDVASLHRDHMAESTYAPQEFPGCTLSIGGATALIFDSGRFIIMGFKQFTQAYAAFDELKALLLRYRTNEPALAVAKRYRHRIEEMKMRITELEAKMAAEAAVAAERTRQQSESDVRRREELLDRHGLLIEGDAAITAETMLALQIENAFDDGPASPPFDETSVDLAPIFVMAGGAAAAAGENSLAKKRRAAAAAGVDVVAEELVYARTR